MSCQNVIDYLTRETGRFNSMIYDRVFPTSPWVGLIKKDVFPEGLGETISNLTYERTAPTDAEPTWSSVTTDTTDQGIEGGACLPAANKIAIASTVRTWNLKRRVLEGPDFCAEDLRTPFAVVKQMEAIVAILSDYSRLEWEIRYRHEYRRLTGTKVVALLTGETTGTASTFPGTAATAQLSQRHLNKQKSRLRRDGADMTALGRENGVAIHTLITDDETSDHIIFSDEATRQDLRYGKPSELLAPYGVERSYRGFYHIIDTFPMRYTFGGGAYTEVAPFTTTAATKGQKAAVNSSWETATYTSSEIFNPAVFTSRIPKPITNVGGGVKFNPVNYMGQWKLQNILDRVCNPDGNIVYHRGILASASEPVHPERGVSFVHLRCDPVGTIASCS